MKWDEAISEFKSYLKLEKSLSEHTVAAYIRDVNKLRKFNPTLPLEITRAQVEEFVYDFSKKNYAERSQARLISSLKSFFNYLRWEEWREDSGRVA